MVTRAFQRRLAMRTLIPWILSSMCLSTPAVRAQTGETQDQPPSSSAAQLIELNRGIRAFIDHDYNAARAAFESILTQDPQNAACLYYLGLIQLEEGLRLKSTDDEAARLKFDQARHNFELVTRTADPTVAPVEAALLLGIAQLAADAEGQPSAILEPAQAAYDTLKRYVETEEIGRSDRYGFFYLGVACYRLGDYYSFKGERTRAAQFIDEAANTLENAMRIAGEDRNRAKAAPDTQRGLSDEAFEAFKLVASYYQGLVALQRRSNRQARELLVFVRDNEKGEVGLNAAAILEKMDEIESTAPPPLTFDSLLGRLDFQGNVSLGLNYDTNVILLGGDTALPLNIGRKYDFRLETEANFNISRYIDKSEAPVGESLSIGLGGGTAHGWNAEIHEFNLNQYSGRSFVQWQPVKNCYLGVEYEYAYTMLGNDPFISSHRITPVTSHIWQAKDSDDELGRTDIWYNFESRDYREEAGEWRLDRDGRYHAWGIRHIFNLVKSSDLWAAYYADHETERRFFGHHWLNFTLGYVYRDERTKGTEFDLHGHSILSGVEVPLPWRLSLSIDGVFTWEDYGAPSVFDYRRNCRNDFSQHYNFGMTRTFVARGENVNMPSLEIKLRAGVGLTFRNSNIWDRLSQDIYEYDRAVYGLQLNIDF